MERELDLWKLEVLWFSKRRDSLVESLFFDVKFHFLCTEVMEMRKLFILLILSIVFASFTGCNIKKGKNQNEEIADQVNEALSDHNTDLVRDLLTNKLKETESDDLKNLVNFVSGDISEVGELSTANTCESDKNATLYTYHIRYHIKDDKGNRYYVAIEYTKKSKMNTDAGVTYISISLLDSDDTDLSTVSIGKAT